MPSSHIVYLDDDNSGDEATKSTSLPLPLAARPKSKVSHSAYTTLLIPLLLFPLSTALAFAALATLPLPSPLPTSPTPKSVSLIATSLTSYASGPSFIPTLHLLFVLALITIWKHSWSIPGAILLNVLAGSIWGGFTASLIMTFLTALGSVAATLISRSLSHWFEGVMPRAVQVTRSVLDMDSESTNNPSSSKAANPWIRLALLRLIGIVPWSGINIASGIVRVAIIDCFLGAMIGCLPWTVVTCQVGDILTTLSANTLDATDQNERTVMQVLSSWEVVFKLSLLTLLSILPILGKGMVKKLLNSHGSDVPTAPKRDNDEKTRVKRQWHWSRRSVLRMPRVRSPSFTTDEEKMGLVMNEER